MTIPAPDISTLNDAQREAVLHENGPLLIVAGAGTGKTTVLTKRYAHLLSRGYTPEHILALTFTEKASGETEDRILSLLPVGTYDFWISTFHGFCERVLEAHGLEIGLPNTPRLLTDVDAWLLLRRRLSELPLAHYKPLGNPTKFLRAIIQHISRAKDEGITPEIYRAYADRLAEQPEEAGGIIEVARLRELANVYEAYQRLLRDEGAIDFGDLILETGRLFRERPAILKAYQAQFREVMVDEFQDTNSAQYDLVKQLVGVSKCLTVVGDDDQAIYKFRGASLANILQFRDDFPDAKTVALTKNYRSKKEILDLAYTSIEFNNPHRLECQLTDMGLSKKLLAERGEGGHVQVVWARSVEDEAEEVVERIRLLKAEHPDTLWSDIAILTRSNAGADPFVNACANAGIPFQFFALQGLYAKGPVVDVFAYLSLLDGVHESTAVWRALTTEPYHLSAEDLLSLTHEAQNQRGISLWEACVLACDRGLRKPISDHGRQTLRRFIEDMRGLAELTHRHPPLRVFQKTLEVTNYLSFVMKLHEREKRDALQWLNAVGDRIKRYEQTTHAPTVKGFMEEWKQEIESGEEGALSHDPDAGPDMVKIMTVHGAKGLEFKHVFVVSLVDQRFPSRPRSEAIPLPEGLLPAHEQGSEHHLEEERRLFYVALTRAKDTLTLTGASEYGGTRKKKPSSFLRELGREPKEVSDAQGVETRFLHAPEYIVPPDEHATYALKRRFSFTQLAAFRKCPLQYKFEHVYRIPKFGTYQKSFGQSIHLVFQRILELQRLRKSEQTQPTLFQATTTLASGLLVTRDEAFQLFEDAWIDEWYQDRAQHDTYKQEGRRAVERFYEEIAREQPAIYELEKDFTLVIGQHSIKGKIDRIDTCADGSFHIVDYKTGQAKEELTTEDKEQLWLYQVALEGRGARVSRLTYEYVLHGVRKDVDVLKDEKKEAFMEALEERMDAILVSTFAPEPDAHVCKYCDFRFMCEFRKL